MKWVSHRLALLTLGQEEEARHFQCLASLKFLPRLWFRKHSSWSKVRESAGTSITKDSGEQATSKARVVFLTSELDSWEGRLQEERVQGDRAAASTPMGQVTEDGRKSWWREGECEMKGQLRTDCQSSEDVMTKVKLTVKHSNILIRIAATKQTCEKTKEETIQQTDCALLMCPIKNDREDSLFGPRRSLRSWRRQPSGLGQVGKLEGLGVEGRVGITSHPAVQAQFQLLHTSGE